MRFFSVLAALVALLSPVPATAEVIAVCGNVSASYANTAVLSRTALQDQAAPPTTRLALWRDSSGFDVVVNWGERDQVSLRGQGADIMGNEMGPDLIHVIVVRKGAHAIEHFLFSLNDDRPGELIWSAPEDASVAADELSYETACIKAP